MRHRLPLLLALLGLSAVGATCKGREPDAVNPPPQPGTGTNGAEEAPLVRAPAVAELEGVEIARVPPAYRGEAIRILNETFCYCGCTRTVASCLGNRSACSCVECSDRVAEFVIGSLEEGSTPADVQSLLVEAFSDAYNAPPFDFDLAGQPMLGPEDAPHTIVEFADFRCPHCKDAFRELTAFAQGRSDVRVAYYYFPLSGFGEASVRAAHAAEAARRQGKFWEMAALLFENQGALEKEDILGYARSLGLDVAKLSKAMASGDVHQAVMADKSIGTAAGVQATPAIYVDGRPLGLPHGNDNLALRLAMEDDREACD